MFVFLSLIDFNSHFSSLVFLLLSLIHTFFLTSFQPVAQPSWQRFVPTRPSRQSPSAAPSSHARPSRKFSTFASATGGRKRAKGLSGCGTRQHTSFENWAMCLRYTPPLFFLQILFIPFSLFLILSRPFSLFLAHTLRSQKITARHSGRSSG